MSVIYVDPYIDRNTGTMKNPLGITNQEELSETEAELTGITIRELSRDPIKGNYDFEHLCKVHEKIFGDIYSWAGYPRIINMEKSEEVLKGNSVEYADYENIQQEASAVLKRMNSIKWDKLTLDERVKEFSSCMADLWKVHPFREGNTRTTVTFCCDFARAKNFGLDRDLFRDHGDYVRRALVVASARFTNMGKDVLDLSKPEYLEKFVKDCMERWDKAHQR